jgi:hypothetical protein
MNLSCQICGRDSGTLVVCQLCRKDMTGSQKDRATRTWHDLVVAPAYDPRTGKYKCFHCGHWFVREKITGDHWPSTKAAAPRLRYDVTAGKPSCAGCNTSGNKNRKSTKEAKASGALCSSCHRLLAVYGDRCIHCVS